MHNTSNIKVSVIVVTFNQEDTIAQTLDSILMQKCNFTIEIQLSDDCSTDSTSAICTRYAEQYPNIIKYHHNSSNKGVRDNYYDALLRCNGEYIADCAGDDFWVDPLKLQKEVEILDADPKISLVHTNWEYLDVTTGKTYPPNRALLHPLFHQLKAAKGSLVLPILSSRGIPSIHLCTALYRKSIFIKEHKCDSTLFRNPEFTCEDLQLITLYANEGAIAFIPDVTLHYRTGHTSISACSSHPKTFITHFGFTKLYVSLAKEFNKFREQRFQQSLAIDCKFLFAEAFLAFDKTRIDSLLEFMRINDIPLHIKEKILFSCTRHKICWQAAAITKKLIHNLKRHK